jgi:hypothetical protein
MKGNETSARMPRERSSECNVSPFFSGSWRFHRRTSLLFCFLWAFFLASSLASKSKDSLTSAPPSVGHDVDISVVRGGSCELVIQGIVMPRDTMELKIAKEPRYGTLGKPQRIDRETVRYLYRNNGEKGIDADRVEFKLKTGPANAWGRVTARIFIEDRPSRLDVDSEILDFGDCPIGRQSSLPLVIRNGGGGILQGKAQIAEPWSLTGNENFQLEAGAARKLHVCFSPVGPGEFRGLLEFQGGSKPYRRVELIGKGVYRFQLPERIELQGKPNADFLEITNLTSEDLALQIVAPNPLIGASSLLIPAGGSEKLKLEIKSGSYSEKTVDLEIVDGLAIRRVRVDLPPSPAVLEWENAPLKDFGRFPIRHVPELTVDIKNAWPTNATVRIEPREGGIRLAPSQPSEFELREGETTPVKIVWNLPEELGEARARLTAWNGGLSTDLELSAVVVPPEAAPEAEDKPQKTSPVSESAPSKTKSKILSEAETRELKLRMPTDILYRLEVENGTATAIVTWNYRGPKPVNFQLERKVVERVALDPGKVFEKRLEVPDQLPPSPVIEKWQPIETKEAAIECIDGTAWQGRVPGLQAGYHDVRITARVSDGKRIDVVAFVIEVGKLPRPAWMDWALWAVLGSSLLLLRRRIAKWLGLAPPPEP